MFGNIPPVLCRWAVSVWITACVQTRGDAVMLPNKVCVQICERLVNCAVPKFLASYEEMCCLDGNASGMNNPLGDKVIAHNLTAPELHSKEISLRAKGMGSRRKGIDSRKKGTNSRKKGTDSLKKGTNSRKKRIDSLKKGTDSRKKVIGKNIKQRVPTGRLRESKEINKLGSNADLLANMRVHRNKKIWTDALRICEKEGGSLVKDDSRKKHRLVKKMIGSVKAPLWIGLTDVHLNDTWYWGDGTPLGKPEHWGFSEPQNHPGENCAAVRSLSFLAATWQDYRCGYRFGFICEKLD